jgi:hypothetical protein
MLSNIGKIIISGDILWMTDASFLIYPNLQIMFLLTCLLGSYPNAFEE